jgi:hypothetical protein
VAKFGTCGGSTPTERIECPLCDPHGFTTMEMLRRPVKIGPGPWGSAGWHRLAAELQVEWQEAVELG